MEAVAAKWKSARRDPCDGKGRYLTPSEMQALAFAAPHRKLATKLTKANSSS